MIIVCPTCETKFKLDDEKVKGKHVKVRCTKCNNIFSVGEEEPEPIIEDIPPQPEIKEPAAESSMSAGEGTEMDDNLRAAIDEALKEFQMAEKDSPEVRLPDSDFGDLPGTDEGIFGDENFSVREEKKEEEDFISTGFDLTEKPPLKTPDFDLPLMEEKKEGKEPAGLSMENKSISESDLISDLEFELGLKRKEEKTPEAGVIPEVGEDDFDMGEGIKPSVPPGTPSPRPFPVPTPTPVIPRRAPSSVTMVKAPARAIFSYIFFILIVIGGVALGYLYRDQLLSFFYARTAKPAAKPQFVVTSSKYDFMQNIRGQTLFIVEGRATNQSSKPHGFLRLKVSLKDNSGNELATKDFYAGNIISEDSLRTDPAPDIESRFNNRVGDALANMNIPPGGTIPFMVVFYDIPNVSTYTIEIVSAEEIQ